jgi:hypothetical protein
MSFRRRPAVKRHGFSLLLRACGMTWRAQGRTDGVKKRWRGDVLCSRAHGMALTFRARGSGLPLIDPSVTSNLGGIFSEGLRIIALEYSMNF